MIPKKGYIITIPCGEFPSCLYVRGSLTSRAEEAALPFRTRLACSVTRGQRFQQQQQRTVRIKKKLDYYVA